MSLTCRRGVPEYESPRLALFGGELAVVHLGDRHDERDCAEVPTAHLGGIVSLSYDDRCRGRLGHGVDSAFHRNAVGLTAARGVSENLKGNLWNG